MSDRNGDGHEYTSGRETILSMADRLPPQNIEAEEGVIGCLMIDPECAHDVFAKLRPEQMYRAMHRLVVTRIKQQFDNGKPFDTVSLYAYLTQTGDSEKITHEDLGAFCESVPHSANALFYADIIIQKAKQRDLIDTANAILREAYSGQFTAEQIQSKAETRIFSIADRSAFIPVRWAGELAAETVALLEARERGEGGGLATGFTPIDALLDGLKAEQLIILAARPSMGKSALALNIADHVGILCGLSTLFVSLEMSASEISERHLASHARINSMDFRRIKTLGDFRKAQLWRDVKEAREWVESGWLFIDANAMLSINDIAATARRIKATKGLELLIIDYLQLIDGLPTRGTNRQEEISRMTRRLKGIARELKIPVIALSQLNRESEKREDKRPRMADLRESGAIEQDADVVMLLHRPDYYDPNDQPGLAELHVAKNRNGPTGTIRMSFFKQFTKFEAIEMTVDEDKNLPAF